MEIQPTFWDAVPAPSRGRTARAKAASLSGAVQASRTWTVKQHQILEALRERNRSRQSISRATYLPINSVCSLLSALVESGDVEPAGTETYTWDDGGTTTRETFRIVRRG